MVGKEDLFPEEFNIIGKKDQEMRYGENWHQKGCFYKFHPPTDEPCIANAIQLQGKKLSFNNILDANSAIECVKEFEEPTCVITKHNTPCGIASAPNLVQAWDDAFATDTYSPFGGVLAFNRTVGKDVAEKIFKNLKFLEVIIALSFDKDAVTIFSQKQDIRLLELNGLDKKYDRKGLEFRSVVGGFLVQDRDISFTDESNWKVVTEKKPSSEDLISMRFAIRCVKHIKSNSVVFVRGTKTVGIGGGQTSRVDSTWIAVNKGKDNIRHSVMASDAFFPFRDAVDKAAAAGVDAIIQPGGSKKDAEVIQAANEHKIAMVFTGQRYFRH